MQEAIVFTHFSLPHELLSVEGPKKRDVVFEHCLERISNFAGCPSIRLVYLFIAEGYQAILGESRPWEGLERERILRECIQEAIDHAPRDKEKFQIVGTRELTPTMAELSKKAREWGWDRLGDLLLGHGEHMYYDSPKVVEAIVRLGRAAQDKRRDKEPEPIFRFDADVEVDENNVLRLLNYYAKRSKELYYFFSGGYRSRTNNLIDRLLNTYAVRVAQFCGRGGDAGTLMTGKAQLFLHDLKRAGADPSQQVISGAGLCMSSEAIRELPPFANIGEQIIWIDDHHKRILHEELGHLQSGRNTRCRATFVQDRHASGIAAANVRWHSSEYLTRLVRGCLLDGLIRDRQARVTGPVAKYVHIYKDQRLRPSYLDLQGELEGPASVRLVQIKNMWESNAYKGTPLRNFARNNLPRVKPGRGLEVPLIREVIKGVDDYIELLGIWDEFVKLCEEEIDQNDPQNNWLFQALP